MVDSLSFIIVVSWWIHCLLLKSSRGAITVFYYNRLVVDPLCLIVVAIGRNPKVLFAADVHTLNGTIASAGNGDDALQNLRRTPPTV